MNTKEFLVASIALIMSACSSITPSCTPPTVGERIYVVQQGWHVDLGIPVEELGKNLASMRETFAGARVIMFGYGKKTFFTAPPEAISEYFLGPFPGTAAIQAVGINVLPSEAYPDATIVTLLLPSGGSRLLSDYVWNDLAQDDTRKPIIVAHSNNPDGLFYQAQSEYNLLHTCNTWIANALHQSGIAIADDNIIFSGQVMTRVSEAADEQCRQ